MLRAARFERVSPKNGGLGTVDASFCVVARARHLSKTRLFIAASSQRLFDFGADADGSSIRISDDRVDFLALFDHDKV